MANNHLVDNITKLINRLSSLNIGDPVDNKDRELIFNAKHSLENHKSGYSGRVISNPDELFAMLSLEAYITAYMVWRNVPHSGIGKTFYKERA